MTDPLPFPFKAGDILTAAQLNQIGVALTDLINFPAVSSVAGRTGAIVLTSSDISNLNTISTQTPPTAGVVVSDGNVLTSASLSGLHLTSGTLGVSFGTASGTAAQGNDSRIVGAAPLDSPAFTTQVTLPSWQSPPSINAGIVGFNTTTTRYDFGIGSSTVNFVRLSGDTMTGVLNLYGNSTAKTQATSDNSDNIATTAFVKNQGTTGGTVTQVIGGTGLNGGTITTSGTLSVIYGTTASTSAQGNDGRIVGAEQTANKGLINGYASLDGSGKVPTAQLPTSIVGALHYLGSWNASTNNPALASGIGAIGGYYIVSTAGTTSIDGVSVWGTGDWIVFDGTKWDKVDGQANPVASVAGRQGAVVLSISDISGGAPLDSPIFTSKITVPSWTSAPSTNAGILGFNTISNRYEFGIGGSVVNHVRLTGDTMTGVLNLYGNSTAFTQLTTDNSTKIATTAYVKSQNYAALDGGGKVPLSLLPSSVAGALNFLGTWNANTNVPAISSGTGTTGGYYVVSISGTTPIDGVSSWGVGDWIVFDGTRWDKLDGQANPVTSVAGRQGAVVLSVSDISGAVAVAGATMTGILNLYAGSTVPTPSTNNNSTFIATTAYVQNQGYEITSNKGIANGYAALDGSGKVLTSQLPSSIVGAVHYLGTWNASTNTPTLTSGTGSTGGYYVVSTSGTTAIDGTSVWNSGDWIVFDGTRWDKLDGQANPVTSVAGRQGAVALSVSDISGAAPIDSPSFTTKITLPSWTAAPSTTAGILGYNSISGRYEFGIGGSVVNHVRLNGDTMTGALNLASGSTVVAPATSDSSSNIVTSAWVKSLNYSTVTSFAGLSGTASYSQLPAEVQNLPLGFIIPSKPTASQVYNLTMAIAVTIPANLNGTVVYDGTITTSNAVFTVNKISAGTTTQIATITITSASHTSATLSTQASASLAVGDVLQLVAPSVQDATLSDLGITILAAKV